MGRVVKVLVILTIIAGAAVGAYAWIRSRGAADPEITLVEVGRGDITEKAVAIGQIEPRLTFHIKSKYSGIVSRCLVEVGDRIAAGEALFEITPDPTPAELLEAERRLERARSAFRRAELDWQRSEELTREGVEALDKRDARREAFELAEIEMGRAADNLQLIQEGRIAGRGGEMESILRAPAAGIVLERQVDPGDPVVPLTSYQAGTELAALADMSDLIFRGTVDEIDVGKLAVGLPARLRIGALPEVAVTGRLSRIAPRAIEADNAKLFAVEIELDSAAEVVLRAGYSANADLVIREQQDVLIIPERLVLFEEVEGENQAATYVELPSVGSDPEPRKVPITLGLSDGLNVEVVSGLEEGAELVERPPREITG